MHSFRFKDDGYLYCEDIKINDIAEKYGTPSYIYSYKTFTDHFRKLKEAFSGIENLICYSVKSCSNIAFLNIIDSMGGGFDIVSIGELRRVEKAKGNIKNCVFAGVGKKEEELTEALEKGIFSFTVESPQELELLEKCAQKISKQASFAIRVNPDVDPETHRYISTGKKENKFGIDMETAFSLYRGAKGSSYLLPEGVHMHIGSQITTLAPYIEAIEKMGVFIGRLKKEGIDLKYFDIGGGFGIVYNAETPPQAEHIREKLVPLLKEIGLKVLIEPGRFIAGNAGVLATKVLYVKESPVKRFAIVDAGMNDLIRPSLYEAYHKIVKTKKDKSVKSFIYDIVGPICESGDYLALSREIPEIKSGDYLAVMSAGAYGFSMSSNYNSRPRPPEILVKGEKVYVIRERESFEDLTRGEHIIS